MPCLAMAGRSMACLDLPRIDWPRPVTHESLAPPFRVRPLHGLPLQAAPSRECCGETLAWQRTDLPVRDLP
jgi:hypothetical protein